MLLWFVVRRLQSRLHRLGLWLRFSISSNNPVQVVVADINYGMMRLVDEQPVTLEQYLSPSYRSGADLRMLTQPPAKRA